MIQSNNTDLIIDLWSRIKPYISNKERPDAAESVISVFDEYGMTDGIEKEEGLDKDLKSAIKNYYGDVDIEEADDEY